MICDFFFPSLGCIFTFFIEPFDHWSFNSDEAILFFFFFCCLCFGVIFKKSLPNSKLQGVICMVSSKKCILLVPIIIFSFFWVDLYIWYFLKKKKIFIYFYYFFIYLFLPVVHLCCCTQILSSCDRWELLFTGVCRLLIVVSSVVVEHGL